MIALYSALFPALFTWLLACAGSAFAGLLAWALLAGATRLWPALLSRRAVWLAAHGVVALAALLPFLPRGAQPGIMPVLTLPLSAAESAIIRPPTAAAAAEAATGAAPATASAAAQPAGAAPATAAAAAATVVGAPATAASAARRSARPVAAAAAIARSSAAENHGDNVEHEASATSLSAALFAPPLWMLIYSAGLAFALARLSRARRTWRGLLAAAQPLSMQALRAHGAFSPGQLAAIAQHRLSVMETSAAISPMLVGAWRPLLLLPQHLRGFSAGQQQMIVSHELHHWRRQDPLCLGLAAALQTLFWFNPALPWLRRRLEWALELSCDQHVLTGRPQQERKQYAAALVMQWKSQAASPPAGGLAFGGIDGMTVAARIRHMQQASAPALSRAAVAMLGVSMAGIVAAGAVLQPVLAFDTSPQAAQGASRSGPAAWRYPLEKMRVTSFFGVHRDVLPTAHKGIDLGAAKGTPVLAVANGVVIAAGPLAENNGRYGNAIIIDHGGQQSLYAHLDSVAVKAGARVAAGQRIGAVGETGFATGPHLHLEARQDGRLLDPAAKLAGLDAYATKRALRVRRQQSTAGI